MKVPRTAKKVQYIEKPEQLQLQIKKQINSELKN